MQDPVLAWQPLTPERWPDLEALMAAEEGEGAGRWGMTLKLTDAELRTAGAAGCRAILRILVGRGPPPGLLAYAGDEAVALVIVGGREELPEIEQDDGLPPLPEGQVMAICCFHFRTGWRRATLLPPLIEAALAFARHQGARHVEAYPPDRQLFLAAPGHQGGAHSFRACGFRAIAKNRAGHLVMRRTLD